MRFNACVFTMCVWTAVPACAARGMSATGEVEIGYLTTSDGVRLFYTRVGDGADALIVPNGIAYVRDFSPLARGRTVVFFDVRNRGKSDAVDARRTAGGIHHDVEDLEAVRRHFGFARVDVLGHSYQGMTAILYALKYPGRVDRIVQIAPIQPIASTTYPPAPSDGTAAAVMAKLAAWRQGTRPSDPIAACREFWAILSPLYVVDPADAKRIGWGWTP